MMMAWSQVISTSDRMCVDSRIGVLLAQFADQLARLADLRRVEAGGRLVEDQHRRVVQQRVGQADALAVALRQRADQLPAHVAQPAARPARTRCASRSAGRAAP